MGSTVPLCFCASLVGCFRFKLHLIFHVCGDKWQWVSDIIFLRKKIVFYLIYFVCVHAYLQHASGGHSLVWLLRICSLPPPGGFLGLNGVTYFAVVHLLPAEPSCWPRKFFINFSLDMVMYSRLALNSLCSRGQCWTYFFILLPLPPRLWDYRHVLPYPGLLYGASK